jgi:predicted acyl esterase
MDEDHVPYETMIKDYDLPVTMRDGVTLRVDVYRPAASGTFPVLYTCAMHNKDLQRVEVAENLRVGQPAWSTQWYGVIEGGDSKRFVANGYVHVIGQVRGGHKSEGQLHAGDEWDHYDTIEWIVQQPWCDGNVGMVGLSAFAAEQWRAAAQGHPALKAIFPLDAGGCYGGLEGFRDQHPGGVIQTMPYHIGLYNSLRTSIGVPPELPPPLEEAWQAAMRNPDYMMYVNLYSILTLRGQRDPGMFYPLLFPFERPGTIEQTEESLKKITIPFVTGAFEGAYTYKMHWQGAQHFFSGVDVPHKHLLITPPAHAERPFHEWHDEIIRWYDHWLKGIDNGVEHDPAVRVWIMGENKWREFDGWPVPETQWSEYYLHSWEKLDTHGHLPATQTFVNEPPDAFAQMPPTQTNTIQRLRYMTEPLADDTLVVGPISLTFWASLDEDDTNWIVILKDVGPDVSVQSARPGERERPDVPERELTRGWLKASHRALDPERSKPWKPWHYLSPETIRPVVPGEIDEYRVEILSTANLFKAGHRICLEITSLDLSEGVAGETYAEYIPNHVCSSKTVLHKVFHNAEYPSHLLLPVIPLD